MLALTTWLAFAGVALAMVLTPGPNMAYLISRSICQGPRAGMISLTGVIAGFAIYVLLAVFGITALFAAVPYAYDALRFAGAAYLAWLAWNALRPNGASPFEPRDLPVSRGIPSTVARRATVRSDSPARLFGMGLLTNLLNPKIAMLYLSLFPQFIDPARGHMLLQGLILGATQIAISACVNTTIVMTAGKISSFLRTRPLWSRVQRWIMGTVLGLLAVRMATDRR